MTAASPVPERRRSRPGSLERPINGRLYRGTWLLVGLPLLLLAFSVARPAALRLPEPAARLRRDALPLTSPTTSPPTIRTGDPARRTPEAPRPGFATSSKPYGFDVRSQPFTATIDGRRTTLVNLVTEKPGTGLSPPEIVVMAHRDDSGTDGGLNDNASGTAALIELARAYAADLRAHSGSRSRTRSSSSRPTARTTAPGALRTSRPSRPATRTSSGSSTSTPSGDAAGRGSILGADTARSPAPGLVETVRSALAQEGNGEPLRPSGLQQLVSLGLPFDPYEQAPFVSRGIPAVTVTTAGARPPQTERRRAKLDARHLGTVGLAAQDTVDAMEQGVSLAQGPASYVFLGQRLVRGWAIEIVLVAMLLPFLAAAVDLFARCRRRRIRIAPAFRSYRSRLGFWAWVGAIFLVFGAIGLWGSERRARALPDLRLVARRARSSRSLLLAGAGWLVARSRLLPRRPIRPEERLAGHSAALLALGVVGLLVAATNPFSLIFVLPSLHAWLWLPQVQTRPPAARASVFLAGFAGPAYLVWTFATHYGLGWDAPWYVAQALRCRLRAAAPVRDRPRLARSGGPARRARGESLRAVPDAGRASTPRPTARAHPHAGARASAARSDERGAPSGQLAASRNQRTVDPAASSPFPRGMWTSASAAPERTIMCDSWPVTGSRTSTVSVDP